MKAEVEALKITIKLLQDDTKAKIDHLKNELSMVKEELGTKAEKDKTKVEVSAQTESESTEARVEEEVTLEDIIRVNSNHFHCDMCDHSSKTKRLLKIHKVRAHTSSVTNFGSVAVFSADPPQDGRKYSKTCL